MSTRNWFDRVALILLIVGGLNWLLMGLFRFDLVAALFNGQASAGSRIVYTLVGICAIWSTSLLFRSSDEAKVASYQN